MSVVLHFKLNGTASMKIFNDAPPALDYAVRLVETHNGSIQELDVRDDHGKIAYTREEIVRVSKQVRLSTAGPRRSVDRP